jgi:hypothetical protein
MTPKARSCRRSTTADPARTARTADPLRHRRRGRAGARAHDIAGGKGAININVLWEMGGAQQMLEGVLEQTKGMVTGVTCGAGMPYKLSEIAQRGSTSTTCRSSAPRRAFRALWKRAYHKVAELLARWSMKIRGWRAGTTACPTPKTR